MSPQVPMCVFCSRLNRTTFSCGAFPGGIPTALTIGHADHRLPLPGDGGIRFRPRDESALLAVVAEWGETPVEYEGPINIENPTIS